MRSNSNSNNAENKENINSNTQQARPAESTKSNGSGSGNRIGANGVILGPDGKPCKVGPAICDGRNLSSLTVPYAGLQ